MKIWILDLCNVLLDIYEYCVQENRQYQLKAKCAQTVSGQSIHAAVYKIKSPLSQIILEYTTGRKGKYEIDFLDSLQNTTEMTAE